MTRPPLILLLLPLAACTTGPDYVAPTTGALGIPHSYQSKAVGTPTPQQLGAWWSRFDDPVLDSIVAAVIDGNLDLEQALARLRQAREAAVRANAGRYPTVSASASAGDSFDRFGDSRTSFSLDADASWEADLFGGVARGVEAARADEAAATLDLAAVRVALIGEAAATYVDARLAQQQLATARETLAIFDETLDIAGWRVQAGLAPSTDVEQARASRAQNAAAIPAIERSYAAAAYRLAVLTGRAPGAMADWLTAAQPIPKGPGEIAAGIPADMLRQRPDVRGAERALAAATARIGLAKAELYPALRLTGNIGASALSIGGLVDAVAGSVFAGLGQTLFDGGRLRSQVRAQRAAADGALAFYRQSVLLALEDVENGLVALQAAKRRQSEFAIALEAASNLTILARSQYRSGLTDFQTLLEAERSLISAREGVNNSRAEHALAVVQLYRALGGGWTPIDPANIETSS